MLLCGLECVWRHDENWVNSKILYFERYHCQLIRIVTCVYGFRFFCWKLNRAFLLFKFHYIRWVRWEHQLADHFFTSKWLIWRCIRHAMNILLFSPRVCFHCFASIRIATEIFISYQKRSTRTPFVHFHLAIPEYLLTITKPCIYI